MSKMQTNKELLFFNNLYLKMSFKFYNAYKFHFMIRFFEGNFIQT